MKQILLFLFTFFTIQITFSQVVVDTQKQSVDGSPIYNATGIEVKPEFPGGLQEFYKFIGKEFKTPNIKGLQGKVFATFIIEKDGSLSDIKVIKDIGYGTGEEALRVLKISPKWKPGEQNGQKVRVMFALPIVIRAK